MTIKGNPFGNSPPTARDELAAHSFVIVIGIDLSVVVDPGWCVVRATDNDSFLDIVKHCVRTIVHSLDVCDTLSLVLCEERALVVLPRTEMSTAGKEKAETLLELYRVLK